MKWIEKSLSPRELSIRNVNVSYLNQFASELTRCRIWNVRNKILRRVAELKPHNKW